MKHLYQAVLGAAGSGKSYRLNALLKDNPSYALKTSSSGISAVNLGGGATTIHSALGYFNTEELLYKVTDGSISKLLKKISKDYRRIACDEIGMLPGQQLDLLYFAINRYNDAFPDDQLGLEVSGDPGQLPPVATNGEAFVPFFQSKCWPRFNIEYLTEIKRQDNPGFIRALMLVRAGMAEEAADWFENNVGFHDSLDDTFFGTTVLSRNMDVDAFNNMNLRKVSAVQKGYKKKLNGKNKAEWNSIPEEVIVKPGCNIILLANNLPEYANGDLGVVEEVFLDCILVRIFRTNTQHLIKYKTIENVVPGTNKVAGTLEYLPIRLAYATTIHKTQGLTLDKVQCRVGDGFMSRLHGGLYTALSRCRTPEGLRIVGTREAFIKSCYVDPLYRPYVKIPDNILAA